jgi:hypothetical protein
MFWRFRVPAILFRARARQNLTRRIEEHYKLYDPPLARVLGVWTKRRCSWCSPTTASTRFAARS